MKKMGIYCIENLLNNKKYIGSSRNIMQRLRQHKHQLKSNTHYNKHLSSSFKKYGETNFIFYIIERVEDINILIEREIYYVNLHNCLNPIYGYNKAKHIFNTSGYKWSEESRLKFSLKCRGRKVSDLTRQKLRLANLTRIYKKGYKHTEKAKKSIAEKRFKKILQYDKDFNFIKEWASIKEIGQFYSKTTSGISACCRGIRKFSLGYIWKFKI